MRIWSTKNWQCVLVKNLAVRICGVTWIVRDQNEFVVTVSKDDAVCCGRLVEGKDGQLHLQLTWSADQTNLVVQDIRIDSCTNLGKNTHTLFKQNGVVDKKNLQDNNERSNNLC